MQQQKTAAAGPQELAAQRAGQQAPNIQTHAGGKALVLSMGDGEREFCTDPDKAYELKERECAGKTVKVASTTCRIVNFDTFEREIKAAGFDIAEKGLTSCPPEFDSLMYAVIK